jgi:two-component system, NtrC family, sensor kinase
MARAPKRGGRKAKAKAGAKAVAMPKTKVRKASPAKGRKAAVKKRAATSTRKKGGSVQARLALKTRELDEAQAQQAATAEILRVIASSPSDVQPVFEAIVRTAVRLLGCDRAFFMRVDGYVFTPVAAVSRDGLTPLGPANQPVDPAINFPSRAIVTKKMLYLPDWDRIELPPYERAIHDRFGVKCSLFLPLLRGDDCIGLLVLVASRPHTFGATAISLAESFRDQALIAIENARLFNETRQSLERQTATANILRVISHSIADAKPVFDEILSSVEHLFGADDRMILLAGQDGLVRIGAIHGRHAEGAMALFPVPLKGLAAEIAFKERRLITYTDVLNDADVPEGLRALARRYGETYSIAIAPLLTEDRAIGVLNVTREPVRAFTEQECELLQTLADQAVIAIENARLFNETKEALERQTATAEVLKIISTSPAELTPVFDAILANAVRLCDAKFGMLFLYEEDEFRAVGKWNLPPAYGESLSESPIRANPNIPMGRVLTTKQPVHVADVLTDQSYIDGYPGMTGVAHLGGARTLVQVPLLKEDELVGTIAIYRQEVRPFDHRQIDLVQNFASQAVIAIENARLFNETREALERQTATADVLKVIASSPTDIQPVFEAIAERTNRLLGGHSTAVWQFADDEARLVAFTSTGPTGDNFLRTMSPLPVDRFLWSKAIWRGESVHIADTELLPLDSADSVTFRDIARARGYRSQLLAPLVSQRGTIGFISVTRKDPSAFSSHHVDLLRTFADQAVIAIQNVELFEEVQARTRELSRSLDDLRTAQDRLVQTEKLASLGQLTAGIAHEIKNPLNFVNNFSSLSAELVDELDETLAPAPLDDKMRSDVGELTGMLKSNLEKVVAHGKRADSIVKNMLQHSREGSGERRSADINALVEESLNLAYHGARAEKAGFTITLRPEFDPDAGAARLYPQEITRALLNLISNGFYAAIRRKAESGDGSFEPLLSAFTRNLGNAVEIRIRDNGTGIPPEVREKMFNPFFTTKPTGEGTGLGLSMTHDIIVKQHGGQIDVETEPGVFTEFIVTLPRDHGNTRG